MADLFYDLTISAPKDRVFEILATPKGMEYWWTDKSSGIPGIGEEYLLDFGPGFIWKGTVTLFDLGNAFEIQMHDSDPDWDGARIGFQLEDHRSGTELRFYHRGWPSENAHFRISSYCWAMYLRIVKRLLEKGERVPFAKRLDV
jgi:uncharacterized protein YndB with AHSA1/START domain